MRKVAQLFSIVLLVCSGVKAEYLDGHFANNSGFNCVAVVLSLTGHDLNILEKNRSVFGKNNTTELSIEQLRDYFHSLDFSCDISPAVSAAHFLEPLKRGDLIVLNTAAATMKPRYVLLVNWDPILSYDFPDLGLELRGDFFPDFLSNNKFDHRCLIVRSAVIASKSITVSTPMKQRAPTVEKLNSVEQGGGEELGNPR